MALDAKLPAYTGRIVAHLTTFSPGPALPVTLQCEVDRRADALKPIERVRANIHPVAPIFSGKTWHGPNFLLSIDFSCCNEERFKDNILRFRSRADLYRSFELEVVRVIYEKAPEQRPILNGYCE